MTVSHDQHVEGFFGRATWLALLDDVGFDASAVVDPEARTIFVGTRPPSHGRSRATA